MICHGYTPDAMLLSTIVPIPKDNRKSLNDSSNYRGIALSSALGKLLDWILIELNPNVFSSSDLQFAYKQKSSATQCTFVVNETINYYLAHNSNVHVILLDASKAFDRVHYVKLFSLLIKRKLCPVICRYLALQYSLQQCRIKWQHAISRSFYATNGVKQGGVLSPILFTIYLDTLLESLKECGTGCFIGDTFVGALGYADDIILLAPTKYGMDKMINICEQFSNQYNLQFNGSKSKHIFFSRLNSDSKVLFKLDGSNIIGVKTDKHLGHLIGLNSMHESVESSIKELYSNVNVLLKQFNYVSPDIKYSLFKTFCMSVYGCQLWNFEDPYCEHFYTAWRKAIRHLLGLPYQTHCDLLHLICHLTF